MRNFFLLAYDGSREDLEAVSDYEMNSFDLRVFWNGFAFREAIPENVALFVSQGKQSDYLANPISWPICSDRFLAMLLRRAKDDIEVLRAPTFNDQTKERVSDYFVANVLRSIRCVDMEKSNVSQHVRPDGEVVSHIIDFVFESSLVSADVHIFRVSESPTTLVLSEELVQDMTGKGLRGISLIRTKSV